MKDCSGRVRKLVCENRHLKEEITELKAENKKLIFEKREKEQQIGELKYVLNDIQAINEVMRGDIESAVAAECGCVVIEGGRTSAAYQDVVGILLSNGYGVEIIPVDQNKKLKIIIKEGEV